MKFSLLRTFRLAVILSICASLLNLLPARAWLLDLNRAFSIYYFWLHVSCLTVVMLWRGHSLLRRFDLATLLMALLSLYYGLKLVPFYLGRVREVTSAPSLDAPTFQLFYANLKRENPQRKEFLKLIMGTEADIVALTELTPEWNRSLRLGRYFPYKYEIVSPGYFGLGLYAKFPIHHIHPGLGDFVPPVIIASVLIESGRTAQFMIIHAMPPITAEAWLNNFATHRRLLSLIKHAPDDLIITGDFNATPFSTGFGALVRQGRMQNAMYGFGLQRTWSAEKFWARFTIDHVLYRGDLAVESFRRLPPTGSDHFPLLVKFRILAASHRKQ